MNHIFHFFNKTQNKHFVYKGEVFTYSPENTGWMADDNLPGTDEVLVPGLDLVQDEGIFSFDTEKEALEKMSLLYGQQSPEIRKVLESSLNYIAHVGYNEFVKTGEYPQEKLMESILVLLGNPDGMVKFKQ